MCKVTGVDIIDKGETSKNSNKELMLLIRKYKPIFESLACYYMSI